MTIFSAVVTCRLCLQKNNEVTYQDMSVKEENLLDIYIFEMYIQRLWAYLTVKQLLEKE